MDRAAYIQLETYMKSCMSDSAHDTQHIYRVLHNALMIAKEEQNVDYDVLITACLLHDIGRQKQLEDPSVCHARAGAKMAFDYLCAHGYPEDFATRVRSCIEAHRFRRACPPETTEEKILFDADKLDATGAMGIARTLLYGGKTNRPLYGLQQDGQVSDGTTDTVNTFFQEYHIKLSRLYDGFLTHTGRRLAAERRTAAEQFYHSLLREASEAHDLRMLDQLLKL